MPPTGFDPRALRAKLIKRLGNVTQFFEATSAGFNPAASPYWSAFDALRRNKPLAEEFVAQLHDLLDFLDREVVPALEQAQNEVPAPWPVSPAAAPAQFSPTRQQTASPTNLHTEETQILDNLAPAPPFQVPAPRLQVPIPGLIDRIKPPAAPPLDRATPVPVSPHRPEPKTGPTPTPPKSTPIPPSAPAPYIPPSPGPITIPPSLLIPDTARPGGDLAGELSLADVLLADKALLSEPPVPAAPKTQRTAPLPGVSPNVLKGPREPVRLSQKPAEQSVPTEKTAPEAVEPAKPKAAPAEMQKGLRLPPIAQTAPGAANRPVSRVDSEPKKTATKPAAATKPSETTAESLKTAAKTAETGKAQAKAAEPMVGKPAAQNTEPVKPAAKTADPIVVKPAAKTADPIVVKPVAKTADPIVVKPVAKTVDPIVVKPAAKTIESVKAAAKPAAIKLAPAKLAQVQAVAEKAPVFDQGDLSDPALSPSQFFRVLDAKLPFEDGK